MKNEFILAFNEVLEEKQLPKEIILQAIESAMVSAYRRAVNASNAQHIEAKIDPDTGKVVIFAEKEVVDVVVDPRTEVSLAEAQRYSPEAELGAMVIVESTPRDFGRVAAQTARQVIQQRIRDAERQAQMAFFQKQLGEIVSGAVQAVNSQGLTIGMEMRAEGFMARKDTIPGERFRIHDRVRALVAEVKDNPRGPQIVLSRTHRDFLRRLLENEVPEIYHGVVEIRSIAREPGQRAKVAVSATQSGIDPVGACVGVRGMRIQTIVRELHDEKIDVIEWNPDPAQFIAKAISPARVVGVYLNEKAGTGKTATVVVPEDQLSLAIGRDGQNARLAAKLTGWRIDIKSLTEAANDTILRLEGDPTLAAIAEQEAEVVETVRGMLMKKNEGRALNPEEYDQMGRFVDRVERRVMRQQPASRPEEDEASRELRALIPEDVYNTAILDSGLSEHIATALQESEIYTVGDLLQRVRVDPDSVFRLQGIGPKAMSEILNYTAQLYPSEAKSEAEEIAPAEAVLPAEVEEAEEPVTAEAEVEPAEAVLPVDTVSEPEAEEEADFSSLFQLKDEFTVPAATDEEEEEGDDKKGKKKGKKGKKKRHVEVEYDPDRDLTIVHRKHKGEDDWNWE